MKQTRAITQVLVPGMIRTVGDPDENFRGIFEYAPIGIYQCTIHQFIAGNPTLARMFGYQSAPEMAASVEIPGELFVDFNQERAAVSAATASLAAIQRQAEFIRRDGSTFTGNLSMKAVRNAQGKVRSFDAFIEDLTARKRGEVERLKMLMALEEDSSEGVGLTMNWHDLVSFEVWRQKGNEQKDPGSHA